MEWIKRYASKVMDAKTAVASIRRGQRLFIGSGCSEPQGLVEAMCARGEELADTQIHHILTVGVAPYVNPSQTHHFRHNAFFIGANVREAVAQGRADYTPVFLSEIPRLFRRGRVPLDWALIQVSPPDAHGYCSYGVAVDINKAAAESAKHVIAEVNPRMPRTLGDSFIHVDQIDALVLGQLPVLEPASSEPDEVSRRIGQLVSELVEDGATIQMGIGSIPDAVLACLGDKKDLGVHTEMFSDGLIPLIESGVVNCSRKTVHRGKVVTSFVMGSRRLYDLVDNNPFFEFRPSEYVNDPFLISQNDKMTAINSALAVDLTGQVCSDSLGSYFYSGIGGQVDFIRGSARSEGGKPIIALPSTAARGTASRIVATMAAGSGIVTSRGDVHYVVTEFGVADLYGKNIRERAMALIHIAHPKFREELMREARERHYVFDDQVAVLGAGLPELETWSSEMTTRNGVELTVRPIRPTDDGMIRDSFYAMSSDSIYHRFFSFLKAMPHDQLKQFVEIDYEKDMTLVVLHKVDEREEIVGVGQYSVDSATRAAEVAFFTRDEWQGQGICAYLLQQLMAIAKSRGIRQFTAEVLTDNTRMLHVFHHGVKAPIRSRLDGRSYHLSFEVGA